MSSKPEWAQYKAQDADGSWFWWERKPVADAREAGWMHGPGRDGRIACGREGSLPNPAWEQTLERVQ